MQNLEYKFFAVTYSDLFCSENLKRYILSKFVANPRNNIAMFIERDIVLKKRKGKNIILLGSDIIYGDEEVMEVKVFLL